MDPGGRTLKKITIEDAVELKLKQRHVVRLETKLPNVDGSGARTMGMKPHGEGQELRTTDAYKLEVYDADGVLLGSLPLDFFVDGIFIYGDRLFLMDRYRGTQFKEYRIKG